MESVGRRTLAIPGISLRVSTCLYLCLNKVTTPNFFFPLSLCTRCVYLFVTLYVHLHFEMLNPDTYTKISVMYTY